LQLLGDAKLPNDQFIDFDAPNSRAGDSQAPNG